MHSLSVALQFFRTQIIPFETPYKSHLYLRFNKLTYIHPLSPFLSPQPLVYSSASNDTVIENFPLVLELTAATASALYIICF